MEMERNERINMIRDCLESMYDRDLIEVWNHYQEEWQGEEYIYTMDLLPEFLEGKDRMDIVEEFAGNTEFKTFEDYFVIGIYGYRSFSYTSDERCPIETDELASWIESNDDDCGNDDLKEVFQAIEEYDNDFGLEEDEEDE